MDELLLAAPLQGWVAPLDEAPDEVFAGRMLGDGVVIDPTGSTVHAPCDGEVVTLARTRHAVTLRAVNGAEILIHVGLDTVALEGAGLEAHVAEGQRVRRGDRLLSLDIDLLAQRAKSLLTPVVVMGEEFEIVERHEAVSAEPGDPLFSVRRRGAAAERGASAAGGAEASRRLALPMRLGLHARPAALLAKTAASFDADVEVRCQGRRANAESPIALMTLGATYGAEVELWASGVDAEAAVEALATAIFAHPEAAPDFRPEALPAVPTTPRREEGSPDQIHGVTASPGLAVGRAVRFAVADVPVEAAGRGVAHETEALARAIEHVRAQLGGQTGGGETEAILGAQLALLVDPDLVAEARRYIAEDRSAAFAWREAVQASVARLRSLDDARLRERADDLIDIERQVLRALSGEAGPAPVHLPEKAILLADDLLPSDFAALDTSKLAGLCTARGGPTSHLAILAASRGIPALVAAGRRVLEIADGAPVVLDADAGVLHVDASLERIETARRRLEASRTAAEQARRLAAEPCRMTDGVRIEVFANVGSAADARDAAVQGAEGCGLLRTEFLFLDRRTPPDEEEQFQAYQAVADALPGRPVIVRTLDVGADKPAPYLNLPAEENPALGLRGVRVSLAHPELLQTQLRAVLRVRPAGQCRIMLPMVSSVEEVRAVRAVLEPLAREFGAGEVQLGIMVETPASALLAERLAAQADFFSIGSNDLSQYALAIDRGDPRLAGQADAMHPAVLRLIGLAAEGAAPHGRPVGVCGGLASDPLAAPVLIGLGVTELSATPRLVPQVKARVRGLTLDLCRELAQAALGQETAAAVRRLVRERLPDDWSSGEGAP